MLSYRDRNRGQRKRNLIIGGAIGAGLYAIFRNPSIANAAGAAMLQAVHGAASRVEASLFGEAIREVRDGALKGVVGSVSGSRLGIALRSMDRLIGIDLVRKIQREIAIEHLTSLWGEDYREAARRVFNSSRGSFDLISTADLNEILQKPHYREHVLKRLPQHLTSAPNRLFAQINEARELAMSMRGIDVTDFRNAAVAFVSHLERTSHKAEGLGSRVASHFGLQSITLGKIISEESFNNILALLETPEMDDLIHRSPVAGLVEAITRYRGSKQQVTEAEIQAIKTLYYVKASVATTSGKATNLFAPQNALGSHYIDIIKNLPTDWVLADETAYNMQGIAKMLRAGMNILSNNIKVPLAPLMEGIMPLKLFPWLRGGAKDFAGTISAGTRQRELYETLRTVSVDAKAASERVSNFLSFLNISSQDTHDTIYGLLRHVGVDAETERRILAAVVQAGGSEARAKEELSTLFAQHWVRFGENAELIQDVHFVGDTLAIGGGIRGRVLDARFGFNKAFQRARNSFTQSNLPPGSPPAAPAGKIRRFFGDSFIGRALDVLGLDRQASPSKFSRLWSIHGKTTDDPEYAMHPLNALKRVLAGSSDINDLEAVIYGIRRNSTLAGIDPRTIISEDILNDANVHEGFKKLVAGGFPGEDMITALREIDAILGGEPIQNFKFFGGKDTASLFKGLHTKINARRIAQDPAGLMAQGVRRTTDNAEFSLDNIIGQEDPLMGISKLQDLFYEEVFQQIAKKSPTSYTEMLKNIAASSIEDKDKVLAHTWALYNEKYLTSNFLEGASRAATVQSRLVQDPLITRVLEKQLKKSYSPFSTWVNPTPEELEGVGTYLYWAPEEQSVHSLPSAVIEAAKTKSFDPISAVLRETTVSAGGAVSPGPFYHSGYRLNRMLEDFGLGLPDEDLQTAPSIYWNLFKKRIVPAFATVEAWKYLNFEFANFSGWTPDKGIANIRAHAALAGSWLSDDLGLTGPLKRIVDLTPGIDQYYTPRSKEEQQEYLTEGWEPVRTGRWWLSGSRSEFLGGRTAYYVPSWYQQAQGDWQRASNVNLNNDDYWRNSIFPTPRYPFSPLHRLLFPYEREHQLIEAGRPYPVSAPLADPNTIWGSIINATIGRILKPRVTYFPEYLEGDPNDPGEETDYSYVKFSPTGSYDLDKKVIQARNDDIYGGGIGGASRGVGHGAGHGGGSGGGSKRYSYSRERKTPVRNILPRKETTEEPGSEDSILLDAQRAIDQYFDISGLYGYMEKTALSDVGLFGNFAGKKVVQDPSRALSYESRWYERNLGGLGGELGEFWRRVIPHRNRNLDETNFVPNNMPSWVPGSDYFIDMKHGDVFAKLKQGALRTPGESFEKVTGIAPMPVRASSVGGSVNEIVSSILDKGGDDFTTKEEAFGNAFHAFVQDIWRRQGILIAKEQRLYDKDLNVSGHFDALLNINGKKVVADIKTTGQELFDELHGPKPEAVAQVNMYMHALGVKKGLLLYVNRDNPNEMKTYNLDYSQELYNETAEKIKQARKIAAQIMRREGINSGELYDSITRAEILAIDAPYSREYTFAVKDAQKQIEEEHDPEYKRYLQARLNALKKRASKERKFYNFYNYRFNQKTSEKIFTVKAFLDANTIKVEESEHPIRLAGVRLSTERVKKYLAEHNIRVKKGQDTISAFYSTWGVHPGSRIKVVLNAENNISDDVMATQRATIFSGLLNLNKAFIDTGVGAEKTGDNSAAGIVARYTPLERAYGWVAEKLAHLDTPLHTKFLKVRSPLEEYKRSQVYGSNTGDWAHPLSTWVKPTLEAMASRNPIFATLTGAAIGSLFGITRSGVKFGAIIGGAIGLGLSLIRTINEGISGEKWIPKRVRKRREVEEYYDTLKYLKYKRLEAQYSALAEKIEGTKINALIGWREHISREVKRDVAELSRLKRKALIDHYNPYRKQMAKLVNQLIKERVEAATWRKRLGPLATRALYYREMSERTLQGSSPNSPLDKILAGIPKYEREIALAIIQNGSREEKKEYYELLSRRQKAALGNYLGIDKKRIPQKERLMDYFKNHQLPSPDSPIWKEDFDINNARIIAAREEGILPIEMGIYPMQEGKAIEATKEVPIPVIAGKSTDIKNTLHTILSGQGVSDISIDVHLQPSDKTESNVELELKHDRTNDVLKYS